MTFFTILFIFLILFLLSLFLYFQKKIVVSIVEKILLITTPLILAGLSLFISSKNIGGTIMHTKHGWPHFMAQYNIKDVIDNIPINEWTFIPGHLFIYILVNYLFYLSLVCLIFVLMKYFRK
jgi:hypothetical protein